VAQQIPADVLLANYLQGFLWADEGWLEIDGATATYWQARLAQHTTVQNLADGRTKWRVKTRIVREVPEGSDAHRLCLALNRYAAGWSFAYDTAQRTIDAIAAIAVPPDWDTFFLRLSEKAKLSAWMSDVIAERLAEALGAVPAFSHPESQSGLRQTYDGTYYYLQTLRGRPEWVLDLTRRQFPPIEDIASVTAKMVGAPAQGVRSDRDTVHLVVGPGVEVTAGFDRHPIFGSAWRSALIASPRQLSEAVAEQLSTMTWALFDGPETSLLGGWTHASDRLSFQQWNTLSEVRNQEQLGSYTGHSAVDLWGFTSTLSDVLGALARREPPPADDHPDSLEAARHAATIMASISEQARPAVSERPDDGGAPADRRLLWLQHRRTIAVAAWFNPIGPTLTTIEVGALPNSTEYLVHYRRHPFSPYYRVVGALEPGCDGAALRQKAYDLLIGDCSLPNVLLLWETPDAGADDVPELLRDRIIAVAEAGGTNLATEAARIAETTVNPWELAAVGRGEAQRPEAEAVADATATPEPDLGFGAWWRQVSSVDNVIANFTHLPYAWDGALNAQRTYGFRSSADIGPLLVTYSTIGMPGTDSGGPATAG